VSGAYFCYPIAEGLLDAAVAFAQAATEAHVVEVEQVTHDDFGSFGSELPRTVVLPVYERAYAVPSPQQQSHGGLARASRCAGDQEETVVVHHALRLLRESWLRKRLLVLAGSARQLFTAVRDARSNGVAWRPPTSAPRAAS
jgi:hypothetical protein